MWDDSDSLKDHFQPEERRRGRYTMLQEADGALKVMPDIAVLRKLSPFGERVNKELVADLAPAIQSTYA